MNAADVTGLPWPVLLIRPDGAIAASAGVEALLGFRPVDRWSLQSRVSTAAPSGTAPEGPGPPWLRDELPFEEHQLWHDRLTGKVLSLRVRGQRVQGGTLLALDPDHRPLPALAKAEKALGALQRSLLSGSSELSLRGILRLLVELACELTGARYGALGVLSRDGASLRDFVHVGIDAATAARIGHVPLGKGLLGAVTKAGRTVFVDDIAADPRSSGFPAHHPPMKSFLGVPLLLGDRAYGNFYVSEKQGAPAFSAQDGRHLERFSAEAARVVGLAEQLEDDQRRLFRALVEHAPYGMAFYPEPPAEPFGNLAAERMLGHPARDAAPDRTYELVRPDDGPFADGEKPERRALAGETFFNVEALVVRPGLAPLPVLVSAAPTLAEDGTPLGAIVVYQDITTLKELERLRQEFAAIVAHDMRTPVQAVLLQIDLLLRRATGETAWVPVATLQNMKRSGAQLARLIGDLLDASRLDSHQLPIDRQVFDAREELRSLLLRLRPTFGGRTVALEDGEGVAVDADPVRFDQIVTNLLENAVKYSEEGAPIHVALAAERGGARIEVQDQGDGIPPDELPHLFERYYRGRARSRTRRGLGLGLYISHGMAAMQGGSLRARSTVGEGSTFELWLPGPSVTTAEDAEHPPPA